MTTFFSNIVLGISADGGAPGYLPPPEWGVATAMSACQS